MASPAAPIPDHQAPLPLPTVTDEILEDILLRLPTPTDLARASTACASFRRIITDRSFLRRFRVLHPPPLLGFVNRQGFHPAEPPHPSAPLAGALAGAADFSYTFVPTGRWIEPWRARDVRQGRVLIECVPEFTVADAEKFSLRDLELAVCDPLFRRYVLLPSIPEGLTAPLARPFDFESFLAPTAEDEDETSFRVICTAWNDTTLFAFVFSSITGEWNLAASPSFSSLDTSPPHYYNEFTSFCFVGNCIYWTRPWVDKLLVLDSLSMEFSVVNSVPSSNLRQDNLKSHVVAGENETPLILFLSDRNEDVSGDHLHIAKLNVSEPADQWKLEKIIPLPRQYSYSIICADKEFLFLQGIPKEYQNSRFPWEEYPFREYFSLDTKTSELKRICGKKRYFFDARPYFGFPPSLSEPCI
ncbi:hypothetical protein QOZ80_7BG0603610 [Eleusine coracana subsp. coracana]|nr:hypothetical protein QOZ80_7BG0603610 [Eleusine coracana subsp. coracana]